MKKRSSFSYFVKRLASLLFSIPLVLCTLSTAASATSGKIEVTGKVYEFAKDGHYEFHQDSTFSKSESNDTYGVFSISGNIANISEKASVPSYEVTDGNLSFFYSYGDTLLNADLDSWHLVEDRSKKVADLTLDSNIMKGAVILQTSVDRKTWIDVSATTNAFSDTPIQTSPIYSTSDVQLINGCFYRIIVVYELRIRTEASNIFIINTDKYEYKKCAEVYELYAYTDSGDADVIDPDQTYNLGSKVRTENFDGYSGSKAIDQDDIHYGWDLGYFFVSGYTDKVVLADSDVVFLKNVGDKVTLWFKLNENINGIQGNQKLTITADAEGYDQYFETPKMNFGRGTLIIRYTDYNNISSEPTIYTNYLEANATAGADTKVQLFEEGDYEVALDYEVTRDELIDKIGHYRIFFKFSVRNGNCMVYPFDVATGSELSNSSMTENGFRLDLAKSRYLKINIKREILKDSADGLVEDTRFNGPAKDGAQYTDEGIYTITVRNEYTNQSTVKKIYVGTNGVLRAHMATGLPIPEINELVSQGATISDDGTIQFASASPSVEPPSESAAPAADSVPSTASDPGTQVEDSLDAAFPVLPIVATVIIGIGIVIIILKKQTAAKHNESIEDERGDDQ